jgi:ABC-type antimicrobial peptide transport system permease subunit
MSHWLYILKSLLFRRRINLAVALGVAAATAVLTGALFVGDSMRGSLRDITLDRLGRIDELLISDLFFRQALARELADRPEFQRDYQQAFPAIMLPFGTADGESLSRASNVTIIGCEQSFWQLADQSLAVADIGKYEVIINQQLADELGVTAAEMQADKPVQLTLRIGKVQTVSADSPIGDKENNSESIPRLTVKQILPDQSIARFGMQPSQLLPRNAFVSLELLQDILQQPEKVNAIFVAGKNRENPPDEMASKRLRQVLQPAIEDLGLLLRDVKQVYRAADDSEQTAFQYQSISSQRMMLDERTEGLLLDALKTEKTIPVFTYLANQIGVVRPGTDQASSRPIPFSMVSAIDFGADFQLPSIDGSAITQLADDEIVLNSWAAEDLGAQVGDTIRLSYFEPETVHGETVEQHAEFRLTAIAKLVEPVKPYRVEQVALYQQRPTLANDPDLTPFVPGVTDRESIENWDLPFQTPGILGKDDDYWKNYRTTPKAFVSLAKGRQLWASKFGKTTSLRIPSLTLSKAELSQRLNTVSSGHDESLGLAFLPLKRNGLAASSGSTPFDALFLSLSFFIIAAAIMLVALLFRLGLEQRATELGVLSAVGVSRSESAKLLIGEAFMVSLIGGLVGTLIGIGYAWLILTGLTTIWVEAIVTPFLKLKITWLSSLIGLVSGIVICVITILFSVLRTKLHSTRELLNGRLEKSQPPKKGVKSWWRVAAVVACLILATTLSVMAVFLPGGESQAGAFVGSGFMLLTGLLLWLWRSLKAAGNHQRHASKLTMPAVAFRNASRKPGRSTLTIGLVAIATFLIVAISSFHLSPSASGTGGFTWVAQSDRPLSFDLNNSEQRTLLFGERAAAWKIGESISLRLKPGADASCNNPYQIGQPRILGIPATAAESLGKHNPTFAWAGSIAQSEAEKENPWRVLHQTLDDPARIPVVIDKNTAMYSLKLFSVGQDFSLISDDNREIKFRVAGFLANSILQGSLLISEENFERQFPTISGYRYFLIRAPEDLADNASSPHAVETAAAEIEKGLSEYGFDLQSSQRMLAALLAVQNTYLQAFQSLGSLGLLLGTFGLATVQLRNVFERRSELALLAAVGFPKPQLARLVLTEHVLLLVGGLAIGVIAALFSVVPHILVGNANVPWLQLLILLLVITLVGLITGILAVRSSLKTPLLTALRSE